MLRIVIAVLIALAEITVANAQESSYVTTEVSRAASIFVAEIGDVQISGGTPQSSMQFVKAKVWVTRILKDSNALGLVPGQFDVTLRQWVGSAIGVQPYYWTNREILSGQKYVVLADGQDGISAMMESPTSVELFDDKVDTIGDVVLILNSAKQGIPEKARNLAAALNTEKEHGALLAEYTAALLAAAQELESAPLIQVLEGVGGQAFSGRARIPLLSSLAHQFRSAGDSREHLVRAFVNLTVRYFITDPDDLSAEPTRLQRAILQNYLPYIRSSERASAALRRTILPRSTVRELRTTALKCAADSRLSPATKTEARALLQMFADR